MAVIGTAVITPNFLLGIIQYTGAVPGGEINEPSGSILPRRTAAHGVVELVVVHVLTNLTSDDVKSRLGRVVLPDVMPVHGGPRVLHPLDELPDDELLDQLNGLLAGLGISIQKNIVDGLGRSDIGTRGTVQKAVGPLPARYLCSPYTLSVVPTL